ncbi:NDP-sugar synthase [Patescibacteria group bacterium]|nr:NDP-sugar synthase [Patescibacteria group bacterium]
MKNNTQVVILAAGKSSRFQPFGYFIHKSLIKVLGKPIIVHTVESVKRAGIKDLILVISPSSEIKRVIGDGSAFGLKVKYVIQKEPTGGGNGLLLAENYIKGDFFLLNASRVDFWEFESLMTGKKTEKDKAILLARREKRLEKYGFLRVEKDTVVDIVEKPRKGEEPSDLRLVGIYLFSKDFLKIIKDTPDEHYRLEKAISTFVKKERVRFIETDRDVPSLKYSWDLLGMKNYLLENSKKAVGKNVSISKSAEIIGKVIIEDNVVVMEGARIKGPCFIGKNTMIGNNAILRGNVDIEENCTIGAYMEVKNSLIMSGTKVHSGFIGDSVIGENCRVGAQFSTANVRLDREPVKSTVNGNEVDTGLKYLGTAIGRDAKIGIKASTMPGIIIGQNALIGPSTVVLHNVADNTKYFTKFKETVIKK